MDGQRQPHRHRNRAADCLGAGGVCGGLEFR